MMTISNPIADVTEQQSELTLTFSGNWTHGGLLDIEHKLGQISKSYNNQSLTLNVTDVAEIDSVGMMLFIHYYDQLIDQQCTLEIVGFNSDYDQLYQLLRQYVVPLDITEKTSGIQLLQPFEQLGKKVSHFVNDILDFFTFFGETAMAFVYALFHPLSIRYDAIIKNIDKTGVKALPIVALTSVLIGIVITYQGAVQLAKFGANIFIVDMITISMTRELAPLITAIVIAGRTGSAFTAQLGVMKITEEIDAMRIMGFEPHQYLVIPRIIALIISLPLLVIFADILGIMAGMFIAKIHLDLSYGAFLHRMQSVLDLTQVYIGLIKAPVFAWLIATVGCYRGFQVAKNTESIGQYTTLSVVNAIFLVIACDAVFSVIFTKLGI